MRNQRQLQVMLLMIPARPLPHSGETQQGQRASRSLEMSFNWPGHDAFVCPRTPSSLSFQVDKSHLNVSQRHHRQAPLAEEPIHSGLDPKCKTDCVLNSGCRVKIEFSTQTMAPVPLFSASVMCDNSNRSCSNKKRVAGL